MGPETDFKIQKDCKISMIMIDLWAFGGALLGSGHPLDCHDY